ncbi:MAG: bifunctional molybdenum cofactor biosynthesis protein MoaC/MoaB, partial [Candidatus Obscuribacterales bacterium]|nr:bifunctional molybdenum cofactor biosynthesis protein MoaC/MoaB [Candidatus Obscuribacterales bacterium]
IPYCHQLPLDFVGVEFELDEDSVTIETTIKVTHKTGVEMEALVSASTAALTIYDMVKMLDDFAEIEGISLIEKTGGKSDFKPNLKRKVKAAVIVLSDSVAAGNAKDKSGKLIIERLKEAGVEDPEYLILPDNQEELLKSLRNYTDQLDFDLILTTGGTGMGPRDQTPEALTRLFDRSLPGVAEAIRAHGQQKNPYAMLSRAVAGLRNKTILVSMPGSTGAVSDALDLILPHILHGLSMLAGQGHEHGKDITPAKDLANKK